MFQTTMAYSLVWKGLINMGLKFEKVQPVWFRGFDQVEKIAHGPLGLRS